jgi:hypothetical protein
MDPLAFEDCRNAQPLGRSIAAQMTFERAGADAP